MVGGSARRLHEIDQWRTPRAGPRVIAGEVARDLKDPPALPPVSPVVRTQGPHERVLREILGQRRITEQASQKPEDRLAIPREEDLDMVAMHSGSCQ